ncbi:hypothetical protein [Streptomyces luteogriseus]|uniref:hypothetical protein n=1 Tax=Streptomyces luteogriseus TaxID=68233 RepID=UPI0037B263A1
MEVKGPGYSDILKFRPNLVQEDFVTQAEKQVAAAPNTPIEWHVAERDVFEKAQKLFADNDKFKRVRVVYTPPTA